MHEEKQPGEYEIEFNTSKFILSSGVNFYNLKTSGLTTTKKMIMLP